MFQKNRLGLAATVFGIFAIACADLSAQDDPAKKTEEAKQLEQAREILKQEEARRIAYEAYRKEIVDMRPVLAWIELNFLAVLADHDRLNEEITKELDEIGSNFVLGNLRLMEAATLLDKIYGQQSQGPQQDPAPLADEISEAANIFKSTALFIKVVFTRFPRADRWGAWEETLRQEGEEYDFKDHAYKEVSRMSPMNIMALAVDEGLVKKESMTGLDGFGPIFVQILIKTQRGEKVGPEMDAQFNALYNTWIHALNTIPQSERWNTWSQIPWHETSADTQIMERLCEEERAARAIRAKTEKK